MLHVSVGINDNELLAEQQYGFRAQHSTEYAAIKLFDHISKEMDSGNTPTALYIDLSKAFDTFHPIMVAA